LLPGFEVEDTGAGIATLGLSPRTVNKHLEHVYAKLGVETRASAAALMTREGAVSPLG
jgi:DNA-binding CsgD family transcriptional regulator